MSKTSIKALRYYDEIGLLKPETTDDFTGYRFYTTNQLFRLHKIQALRQIGMSIDNIKLIMSGNNKRKILECRKTELIEEIFEKQNQLSRLEFILNGKEEEMFMNYVAVIKDLPECIVYSKKMVVPNYSAYFNLIPAIGKQLTDKYPDLKCTMPEYCFIVYLDGEYKEVDINIEFCESIDRMKPDFDDIKFKKIESVTAVTVMHKGAYDDLPKAYAFIYQWIEQNDYIPADSPRESYIDGIWNKENVNDWLTEIQIPITKK